MPLPIGNARPSGAHAGCQLELGESGRGCPDELAGAGRGVDMATKMVVWCARRQDGRSLQQLAGEAFAALLTKRHRPRTFVNALKQSARPIPE